MTRRTIKARPPAILIKGKPGSSYADTVRSVRQESGVKLEDNGVQLAGMRKTRDGHLLLEVKKGPNAEAAAAKFGAALSQAMGDKLETVRQLGVGTEIEILDIDPVTTKEEIYSALYNTALEKASLDRLA